jgi:hypothetical protein
LGQENAENCLVDRNTIEINFKENKNNLENRKKSVEMHNALSPAL